MITGELQQGVLTEVTSELLGSETATAHLTGDVNLYVYDSDDFYDDGGQLQIVVDVDEVYVLNYLSKDDDSGLVVLSAGLPVDVEPDTQVLLYPNAPEKWAQVQLDEDEESIRARIPYNLSSSVEDGIRDANAYEGVEVQLQGVEYVVTDFFGKEEYLDGTGIDPSTLPPSGSPPISTAPTLAALAGLESVFLTWDFVTPDSAYSGTVYYEVHCSTVSGFVPDTSTLYSIGLGPTMQVTQMPDGSPLSTTDPTFFLIRAFTTNELSPWSNQASATALAGVDPSVISAMQADIDNLNDTVIPDINSTVSTLSAKFPINTADIADGAVIGAKITDGTITTSKIGNLQITAPLIADATIVTAKYGAGSVTSTVIGDNSVTSAKIVANTIVAADIAANTITAAQIAANTITASQIASDTITATQIAANAITSSELSSGAVTTNKLNVILGGGNYVTNSSFESTSAGMSNTGSATRWSIDSTQGWQGAQSLKIAPLSGDTGNMGAQHSTPFSIGTADGQAFTASLYAKRGAGTGAFSIVVRWMDAAKAVISGAASFSVPTSATTWTRVISPPMVAPANARYARFEMFYTSYVGGIDVMYLDGLQLELGDVATAWAPLTAEILPGTIVAAMISANTITAAQIAASTITTNEIAANTIQAADIAALTITAAQIAATTIDASKLVANTITAAQIAANTITASQIAANTITASQIAANTITAAQIAANTITTSQLSATAINGMTITGATIQTVSGLGTIGVSGLKISNDVAGGIIRFYNGTSGTQTETTFGAINPFVDSFGVPSLEIHGPALGSAGDTDPARMRFWYGNSAGQFGHPWIELVDHTDLYTNGQITCDLVTIDGNGIISSGANLNLITTGGNLRIGSGSNIAGKLGTNYGSNGTCIAFNNGYVAIGLENYNSASASSSNTQPLHTAALHSWIGGLIMEDLAGGGNTQANVNNAGRVVRVVSSRRYKENIKPLSLEDAQRALKLESVTYQLKDEADSKRRHTYAGFIAEQAHEAGMKPWIGYDKRRRPESFRYGELTSAHNMLIKDLYKKLEKLEKEVASLKAA